MTELVGPAGEFIRTATAPTPPPDRHECAKPKANWTRPGDVWFCFGCGKRYIYKCVRADTDNMPDHLAWRRRRLWWPRHKHQRLRDYSRCRCGKFVSARDVDEVVR